MWGEGKERKRGSKYNVCNFYRFIRLKSGIRGSKKRKKKRGEREGKRAQFGEEKKERKMEKRQSGRKKTPKSKTTS